MSNINLNNVRVDDQTGRVSFSGLQSGIDTETAVNQIITAKRIPIDRIETQIDVNRQIIAGVTDWRTLMDNLQQKAGVLYGEVGFGNANDVFKSKQAFANATRSDGGTASAPGALIGVTLDNTAEIAVQEFEILQRASRQEVSTAGTLQKATALGITGTFELSTDGNGLFGDPNLTAIVIEPTDTLLDIRDKINNANAGPFASGVTAQVVTTIADDPDVAGDQSQAYLILRADTAGETIFYETTAGADVFRAIEVTDEDGTGNIASVADAAATFANEVSPAAQAQIALTDALDSKGGVFSASFLNITDVLATPGTGVRISIDPQEANSTLQNPGGALPGAASALEIELAAGPVRPIDILNEVAASRTAAGDVAPLNVPAGVEWREMSDGGYTFFEIVANDDGTQRLNVFKSAAGVNDYAIASADPAQRESVNLDFTPITAAAPTAAEQAAADGLAAALDFTFDPTIVTRNTNQIDDLFQGVTLDLLQAEPGTTIELDIQRDLGSVKQAIVDFVEAYNEVVRYGNLQREIDPLTGDPVEEAVLANTSILSQTESLFDLIGAQPADGFNLDFRALAEIGIEFASLDVTDANPLERKTLTIDDAKLDNALLTDFEAVDRLFALRVQSNQSQLTVLGFDDNTAFTNQNGIQLTTFTAFGVPGQYQALDSAGNPTGPVFNFDTDVNGNITFTEGPATGLKLFYSGDTAAFTGFATLAELTMSRGIGANFFFDLDRLVDTDTGSLSAEIDAREADNELKSSRVDEQLERLEAERIRLTEQFNRMEAALAQLESMKQQIAAAFGQTESE